MPNHSEIEELLIAGAFNDGLKIGAKIRDEFNEGILAGTIKMPLDEPLKVDVFITDFFQYEIPLKYRILGTLGSPFVMSTGNAGLAVGGGAILLKSGKNLLEAKNRPARIFYALSMMCSGTGTVSSTVSIYCQKCGLSRTGMLGDGFGLLFLKAGNYMNNIGESIEGKRKPKGFGINRFLPRGQVKRAPTKLGVAGYKGMSFVPHSGGSLKILSEIPYAEIITIGGTVYTVYRCTKFLIKGYCWMYRSIEKKLTPKLNSSQVIHFTADYLIEAFQMKRVYKIYYVALQLQL
jgi:hypothetical protein